MTIYYSNSRDYNDDIDQFEAGVRAEQEDRDLDAQDAQDLQDAHVLVEFLKSCCIDTGAPPKSADPEFNTPAWFDSVAEIPF